MGRQKWREEAHSYLKQLFEQLSWMHESSIHQEEYKADFFKIFAKAYRAGYCAPRMRLDRPLMRYVPCAAQRPLISGETILRFARENGWHNVRVRMQEKREEDIQTIANWWTLGRTRGNGRHRLAGIGGLVSPRKLAEPTFYGLPVTG